MTPSSPGRRPGQLPLGPVEVLVVGAGPVGLTAAAMLGRYGIRTLVVDRNPTTSQHPRAVGIHSRTMETFRRLGVADDIRQAGLPNERAAGFGWLTRLNGVELGRIMLGGDVPPAAPSLSPEPGCFCPQHRYEPVLLDAARSQPSVTVQFRKEVVALEQSEAGVTVTITDHERGELQRVQADYVIAADGANSTIRALLGLGETGTPAFGHSVNVHFRADLASYVQERPFVLTWIVNTQTQGTLTLASSDANEWAYNFSAERGREYSDAELVEQVRWAVGDPELSVEVLDVLRWDYDQAVTTSWRSGRVLVCGDAAHRFPPHGGYGMNSGVQDAENLAWKLRAVLRGAAAAGLLDSYESERKPVAEFNGERALINTQALQETLWLADDPAALATAEQLHEGADIRQRTAVAVARQRDHFFTDGQQLGFVYESAAVVDDGTPAEQSTVSTYHATGHPGARAPHLWLEDHDGARRSTVDLCTDRFVLLAGPGGGPWMAAAQAAEDRLGIAISGHVIGTGGDLHEVSGSWTDLYGVSATGAVLVRPDGHVAARFAALPADAAAAVIDALGRVLHRISQV